MPKEEMDTRDKSIKRLIGISRNLTGGGALKSIRPELLPVDAAKPSGLLDSAWANFHLRWMEKKDSLDQDMFLLGKHSPVKRWLAFKFCEKLERECEYIALTSDTSESDLKSRRELRRISPETGSTELEVRWFDQAVVRAAINGSVLVLEGLEKAERNVLPVLNNLLENREMHLEDGRFLVAASRYDRLMEEGKGEAVTKLKLIRCSENFRVICIGIPSPPFPGNPLDPPLRSRFQARHVDRLPSVFLNAAVLRKFDADFSSMDKVDDVLLNKIVKLFLYYESIYNLGDVGYSMQAGHGAELSKTVLFSSLMYPSESAFLSAVDLLKDFPDLDVMNVFHRIFPFSTSSGLLTRNVFPYISEIMNFKSRMYFKLDHRKSYSLTNISRDGSNTIVKFEAKNAKDSKKLNLLAGEAKVTFESLQFDSIINNEVITEILQSIAVGKDICIIGPTGEGKTYLTRTVSQILGYDRVETLFIYEDMTVRDLMQRRTTNEFGESIWENTCLIKAMQLGRLCILDGIHRLSGGIIAGLVRLIQDRELELPDGTRFVAPERYRSIVKQYGGDEASLRQRKVFRVHPGFRIVALAAPTASKTKLRWLNNELLQLFHFFVIDFELNSSNLMQILSRNSPNCPTVVIEQLIELRKQFVIAGNNPRSVLWVDTGDNFDLHADLDSDKLEHGNFEELVNTTNLRVNLSLRQLIRAARRAEYFAHHWTNENKPLAEGEIQHQMRTLLERTLMTDFMPQEERMEVYNIFEQCGFTQSNMSMFDTGSSILIKEADLSQGSPILNIGGVSFPVTAPQEPALIPETLFFPIENHKVLLRDILLDFIIGEDILLMGNQGVGKNKLTDTLLRLIYKEREYIQLHRDTTVQNLTVLPTLKDNKIVFEDSALIKSMVHGRVLVIDEFDKAPSEVVLILKQLIVDGEISLSDGRRFVSTGHPLCNSENIHIIDHNVDGTNEDSKEPGDVHIINRNFRIMALANRPGFPFLGNNFYRDLGDAFAGFQIGNPDKQSEIELLKNYAPNVDEEIVIALADVFQELRKAVDQGRFNYPYSTRELVNIVRHLDQYPNEPIEAVLENVFAFDIYDPTLRAELKRIFENNGVPFVDEENYQEELLELEDETVEAENIDADLGDQDENEELDENQDDDEGGEGKGGGGKQGRGGGGSGRGKGKVKGSGKGKGKGSGSGGKGKGKGGQPGPVPFRRKTVKGEVKSLEEIKDEAAKAMKKLQEEERKSKNIRYINSVSEEDEAYYNDLYSSVEREVLQLRNILLNVEAKEKERVWLRNKMNGEIDENKITDLAIGEKNVFKRRGKKDQKNFAQMLPKKLLFLVDCSASMSVFAGDNRLDRLCATIVMVMEALVGLEHKYSYEIIGHSGETPSLLLAKEAPSSRKHRVSIIKKMIDHADNCESGDHTLTASIACLKKMKLQEADDYFLFLFSDANLEGYGVEPKMLADVLTSDKDINAYAIFIAEPYSAEEIMKSMPVGRAHVALDTKKMPFLFRDIFTKAMLNNSKL